MNCKPGDLAFVIRSEMGYEGLLVEVLGPSIHGPGWWWIKTSRPVVNHFGIYVDETNCEDCRLRPIRDNDKEDETIQWAGKPQEVTV